MEIHQGTFYLSGVVGVSAPDAKDLVDGLAIYLERLTGIGLTFQPLQSEPADITINCQHTVEVLPAFGDNETYRLEIDTSGIRLIASTRTGIFYGLQTLLQLGRREENAIAFPHCDILDKPRFKWRGLKLDVSRHFMPLDLVKRMVDGMSRVKLNVLHLGLSNNQGFRVESRSFPRLHKVASGGEYYSQDEIRDLIAFAGARGVRIVPEFNMPGHSTCFTLAYQELASGAPPTQLRKTSGVFDDEMNPASIHMDRFLEGFIAEMAALFPDPYWHFGGDEVTGKTWDADPSIQAFKKEHGLADNKELQAHFTARILGELKKNGKRGIGWEEVANSKPPKDTVIQAWMEPASNKAFEGYPLIISTSYYLDHFFRAEDYYLVDPEPEEGSRNVIGAEACIWSEVMNADNVEAIIWPGALALAERFWSRREIRDVALLRERLFPVQDFLAKLGCADLQAPTRLAQKLCGGPVPPSVALLRDYAAPLVYYFVQDRAANPHNVTQPFSRLLETLLPETPATHHFEALVDKAVAGDAAPLMSELWHLAGLSATFREETAELPDLHENQPLADLLAHLAEAVLEALSGHLAPPGLDLDALMPPASNDLTGVLEAVSRRRKADLPMLLKETSIPVLPALRRILEQVPGSADPSQKPS
jgi:hexosaminidase